MLKLAISKGANIIIDSFGEFDKAVAQVKELREGAQKINIILNIDIKDILDDSHLMVFS